MKEKVRRKSYVEKTVKARKMPVKRLWGVQSCENKDFS